MNQTEFINLIKQGALEGYKKYHILPSLTMAQAILESGWGQYAPGNNCFGIKWYEGSGYDKQLITTKEYTDGQWRTIQDYFKVYLSLSDCLKDHAALLTTKNYSSVVSAKNYVEACKAVQASGYATAPDYAVSLINIIETNKLQNIDAEAQSNKQKMLVELEVTEDTDVKTDPKGNYVKTFHKGDKITAIDISDDGHWYITEIGYVWKNSTKPKAYPYPFLKEYKVLSENTEVMDKPNGTVIKNFNKNDAITTVNEAVTEKWYMVVINGKEGWINGKDLGLRD